MKIPATTKPSGGLMTRPSTTLPRSAQATASRPPAWATPAPTRPPTKACVELLGSPRYQVARFQAMAPSSPAITLSRLGRWSRVAMVLETALPKKSTVIRAPIRLSTAESSTARRGERARVETEVAMALAVSWKPLVKSKATATTKVATSRTVLTWLLGPGNRTRRGRCPGSGWSGRSARGRRPRPRSCALDLDGGQQVRDRLALVHRRLQDLVEVLPLDQLGGRQPLVREQPPQGLAGDDVALVLETVDLHPALVQVLELLQLVEGAGDLDAGRGQALAQGLGRLRHLVHPVQLHLVAGLLGEVDDVVERGGQGQDVVLVQRGHEGTDGQLVDGMRDLVAAVLEVPEPRVTGPTLEQALGELGQGVADQLPLLPEEVVEVPLARHDAQPGSSPSGHPISSPLATLPESTARDRSRSGHRTCRRPRGGSASWEGPALEGVREAQAGVAPGEAPAWVPGWQRARPTWISHRRFRCRGGADRALDPTREAGRPARHPRREIGTGVLTARGVRVAAAAV